MRPNVKASSPRSGRTSSVVANGVISARKASASAGTARRSASASGVQTIRTLALRAHGHRLCPIMSPSIHACVAADGASGLDAAHTAPSIAHIILCALWRRLATRPSPPQRR
eukprot:scaffold165017_cov39-Tisochrysis_lutea.AAC.1